MIDFELEDTDGRRRRLSEFRGRPVVLVVAGRETGEAAARFGAALAPGLTRNDAVIITVADAAGVPRLVRGLTRGMVRSGLERAQRQAAREVPDLPADAWERFTLFLDWDGRALAALGLTGRMARFQVLVLDHHGEEVGRVTQGDASEEQQMASILAWVQEAE
jgi:hypothetical protein